MKEAFIQKRFRADRMDMIGTVHAIVEEYQAEGYTLTLRQLFYQCVARGFIENSQAAYKRLGDTVNDARLAGLIDWDMIEDRGRETITPNHWASPADILHEAAQSFAIDKWADQAFHVEVMVEKQALEGVLIPVCRSLDVRFTANRGYSSSSALYETGKRISAQMAKGKTPVIFYLGDHDPSGLNMTDDILRRVGLFARCEVMVNRLALNMDQVEAIKPPENPVKELDSRADAYIARFGSHSWELDAIEPRQLASMVTKTVEAYRDPVLWEEALSRERSMKRGLEAMAYRAAQGQPADPYSLEV